MSATVVKVIPKAGTTYAVNHTGAVDIKQRYQVVLSEPLESGALLTVFSANGVSVPAIGSEHPSRRGYFVERYDISQPNEKAKATLDVVAVYTPTTYTTETIDGEEEEEEPVEIVSQVEEWGWDDSTTERELVTDAAGFPVVNSAGDFFEDVPTVHTPAPQFTKVIKMPRRVKYSALNCTINSALIKIGDMTCPPRTLLCTISERRNINDSVYPYTYTVHLKYRSNKVIKGGDTIIGDIGWDVAIADAGMREIDDETGKLKLIQTVSKETGELVNVQSPELLDGYGHAVARSASGAAAQPYNLVFAAYEIADFPEWLYSEP